MNIIYKNKYGSLELKIVSPYVDVRTIHSKNVSNNLFFELNIAEQVALITENRGIQLSVVGGDHSKMFLIHHKTSNVAALTEIVKLDFNSTFDAQKELEKERPSYF